MFKNIGQRSLVDKVHNETVSKLPQTHHLCFCTAVRICPLLFQSALLFFSLSLFQVSIFCFCIFFFLSLSLSLYATVIPPALSPSLYLDLFCLLSDFVCHPPPRHSHTHSLTPSLFFLFPSIPFVGLHWRNAIRFPISGPHCGSRHTHAHTVPAPQKRLQPPKRSLSHL